MAGTSPCPHAHVAGAFTCPLFPCPHANVAGSFPCPRSCSCGRVISMPSLMLMWQARLPALMLMWQGHFPALMLMWHGHFPALMLMWHGHFPALMLMWQGHFHALAHAHVAGSFPCPRSCSCDRQGPAIYFPSLMLMFMPHVPICPILPFPERQVLVDFPRSKNLTKCEVSRA